MEFSITDMCGGDKLKHENHKVIKGNVIGRQTMDR